MEVAILKEMTLLPQITTVLQTEVNNQAASKE